MLSIKLLKKGWMTTSGSSLLRMMQNVSTPVLDLIVRESLQNSLDAGKKTLDSNKDKIRVDFKYSSFDSKTLADELEGVSSQLHKFDDKTNKFLSITDTNTIGLTGNLNGIFDVNEKNQHLGKLVFQIMKPQDNEGSGGSWGIGKTVYYRLGLGLIIYYSRIKKENGEFEDRLVAALVEDENKSDGLLKTKYPDSLGAAFFGVEEIDEINNLRAMTDSVYIKRFLEIFDLKPLTGEKTGTTIIIPYIDEERVLKDNLPEDSENLWWTNSVEDYLKVSIFRWYFPRLSKGYTYGCKLFATINDNPVSLDTQVPIFRKLTNMYTAAFSDKVPEWITKKAITRKNNVSENEIGWFMYAKINKDEIMPNNLPSPYSYCQVKQGSDVYNTPIICFCRRPGMIINYNNEYSIKTDPNEIVLGVFVLNSLNSITSPAIVNMDEYIRQSEKSDHMHWIDHEIVHNQRQVAIVGNIMNQIKEELEKKFGENNQVSGQAELNTVLAHKFGKKFMPDEGYGASKSGGNGGGGDKTVFSHKSNYIKMKESKLESDGIKQDYDITINDKIKSLFVKNIISTVGKDCQAQKWEDLGMIYPINLKAVAFRCEMFDKKKVNRSNVMYSSTNNEFEFFEITELKTNKGTVYGYKMEVKKEFKPIEFVMRIHFDSIDKLIQSTFVFSFEEDI